MYNQASETLQKRVQIDSTPTTANPMDHELSLEHLFAVENKGSDPLYNTNSAAFNKLYNREVVSKFIDAEAAKKNIRATEAMSYMMETIRGMGYSKNPFSYENFNDICKNPDSTLAYIAGISNNLFGVEGDNHMKTCFENVVYNSMENIQKDPTGTESFFNRAKIYGGQQQYGLEGLGVAATYQNEDHFSGLLGFAIANYFARAKSLELFYAVKNNDKPELAYRYILEYAIDPRTMEKLPLPDAERDGRLEGAFDLTDAVPTFQNANATPEVFEASKIPLNGGRGENGWVKTGVTGNLLSSTPGIEKDKNALEPNSRIQALLYISDYTGGDKTQPVYSILPIQIETQVGEGLSQSRRFGTVVSIPNAAIIDAGGNIQKNVAVEEYIGGYLNIDEGDYLVTSTSTLPNVASCIVGCKFYAKISDTANLRGGLQSTLERYAFILRTEYSRFGTIPINPYIKDNWGLGNSSVGWAATMTDAMSKRYAITRDLKAERHLADDRSMPGNQYKLYKKMGAFVADTIHDMTEAPAGGSQELLTQNQLILKNKLIYKLIDCETYMNFTEDMEKLWVLMGHENKIFAFTELKLVQEAQGNDEIEKTVAATKYGFNVESSAGFRDNYGRRVRVIGAKDKRWTKKEIFGVLRSNTLAAPTTIYFPFMFRIFTGIDPRFTNLPSIQFYGRDAFYTLAKGQLNLTVIKLDGDTQSNLIASTKERVVQEANLARLKKNRELIQAE